MNRDEFQLATQSIAQLLSTAQDILLVTHLDPDGDALGSITAVANGLHQMKKMVTMACDGPFPASLLDLPLIDALQTTLPETAVYDLIIVLDCGDETRMGSVFANFPPTDNPIVNIDHHITNTRFGTINLVDPTAVSTTEILFCLFQELNIYLTPPIATSLLTGLVTDTLGFRTSNVTGNTLKVAGALVEAGGNLADITYRTLSQKSLSTLRLWQTGLNKFHIEDGLAWASISNQERLLAEHYSNQSNGLVNLLSNVVQVNAAVVLIETEDQQIKASFRCHPPFNVSTVASQLGGGGHAQAAGCTLNGPLGEAEARVVSLTKQALQQQRATLAAR